MFKPIPENTYWFIVVGLLGSGRSTFIDTICDEAHLQPNLDRDELEKDSSGIIAEFGKIEIESGSINLFATPFTDFYRGKYNPVWEFWDERMDGFIVMVDSSKPETFNPTRNIIYNIVQYTTLPYIVAANKQDLFDAWNVSDVQMALNLPNSIAIISCNAHDKNAVANVLIALCEILLRETISVL